MLDRLRRELAGMLQRGSANRCRLGDYVLSDRIGQGRMAGTDKAKHRLGQTGGA